MAISIVTLCVLMFVGLCWCIGARSRLFRLRAGVKSTGAALADALQLQANWVQCLTGHAVPRPQEAAWQRAHAAAGQVLIALQADRSNARLPDWHMVSAAHRVQMHALDQMPISEWVSSFESMNDCGEVGIPIDEKEFLRIDERVCAASDAYRDAAHRYNQAIALFPANCLAWALRLRAAGVFQQSPSQP